MSVVFLPFLLSCGFISEPTSAIVEAETEAGGQTESETEPSDAEEQGQAPLEGETSVAVPAADTGSEDDLPDKYIYEDDGMHYFMDTETFDQVPLSTDQLTDSLPYLSEQLTVELIFFEDQAIAIDLPLTVDLKVVESPPGLKGDTATGATKPATVETGLQLQVPLFIDEGETVKVDTRSGQYLSRA